MHHKTRCAGVYEEIRIRDKPAIINGGLFSFIGDMKIYENIVHIIENST